jgi:cytidine deaminase
MSKKKSLFHASSALTALLLNKALQVREKSYSPYSECKVGAALRSKSGKIYVGCNVENSSIGATVCAERGAIQTAIAAEGHLEIAELAVISDASPAWMPCGLCRQVLSEFGKDFLVTASNLKGETQSTPFSKLYPSSFTADEMREVKKKTVKKKIPASRSK